MSKTLLLVRHSKAENRFSSLRDYDRSLTKEGITESERMAGFLFNSGIKPDAILTSSARRASETANIFAIVMNVDSAKIISTRILYYSSAKTILDQISNMHDTVGCLLIVAHNPGISELSGVLSYERSSYMENTRVSLFEYDINDWSLINKKKPIVFKSFSIEEIK